MFMGYKRNETIEALIFFVQTSFWIGLYKVEKALPKNNYLVRKTGTEKL